MYTEKSILRPQIELLAQPIANIQYIYHSCGICAHTACVSLYSMCDMCYKCVCVRNTIGTLYIYN